MHTPMGLLWIDDELYVSSIEGITVFRGFDGSPWVGVMFLWNMNFAVLWGGEGNPDHEQASFGILNPDWSPRPSFVAIQGYLATK